jgi:hypothetical protein
MEGLSFPQWLGPALGSLFAGAATLCAAILSYRSQATRIKGEIERKDHVSEISEFEAIIRGNKILRDSLLQRIAYCERVCAENDENVAQIALLRRQVNILQDKVLLVDKYEGQIHYLKDQVALYERQILDLQERLLLAERGVK